MYQRSGSANLPLHGGHVPAWLTGRMAALGRVIVEAIVHEFGRDELLCRLAHPFWFQSFGAVMGMDWHSSGITTSVIGALKRGLAPVQDELGLYVCGGKGAHSRRTPGELLAIGERTGVDANALVHASRLVAKIDSAAVQDGYELYLHAFFATAQGRWCVVQQGMNAALREARRYHWHSHNLRGFFDSPHSAIEGRNVGPIVNLADARAERSRRAGIELVQAGPDRILSVLRRLRRQDTPTLELFPDSDPDCAIGAARTASADAAPPGCPAGLGPPWEPAAFPTPHPTIDPTPGPGLGSASRPARTQSREPFLAAARLPSHEPALAKQPHLQLPAHHEVRASDVMLRRLHATLAAAADRGPTDFSELLLTPGVGARTIASLAFAAEVIYGAPSRFADPARFSLAHGGKDGHPFPVPLRVYDRTLSVLKRAVERAKLGSDDALSAIRRLDAQARLLERIATGPSFDELIADERARSREYGGRAVQTSALAGKASARTAEVAPSGGSRGAHRR